MRPEVLAGIGGFGALVEIGKRFREPVLVAGTDGVGTKLKLAFAMSRHDTIGIDLVAMSANDILVQGAEPLFFLDYFACGKLDVDVAAQVIRGIVPGDVVLGLASSGPHSNGYSLIRRIVERSGADLAAPYVEAAGATTLGDALLAPTRIYVKPLLALMRDLPVKGMAHITGGGLTENVPRVLPEGVQARLDKSRWPRLPVFTWLQAHGGVDEAEMHRVFNCGIGMVVIVAPEHADRACLLLAAAGESVHRIGAIVPREAGTAATVVA
jgi:phosphoribosylformylglycinamidine cyclo-ligase